MLQSGQGRGGPGFRDRMAAWLRWILGSVSAEAAAPFAFNRTEARLGVAARATILAGWLPSLGTVQPPRQLVENNPQDRCGPCGRKLRALFLAGKHRGCVPPKSPPHASRFC